MLVNYLHHHNYIRACSEQVMQYCQNNPHWTEQFQSICVGLGALSAGLGGLKILLDWLQQKRLKRKVSRLLQRYPIDSLNEEYELIDTKSIPGKWWLIDKRTKTKHWVRNLESARDMGWTYKLVKHIPDSVLKNYAEGEQLNTREL